MSIDNIIFEKEDSDKETAIKTVLFFAGSPNLKKEMQRIEVDYTKVQRGGKTNFVLRSNKFGKVTVTL